MRADSTGDVSQLQARLDQAERLCDEKQKAMDLLQRKHDEVTAQLEKSRTHESELKAQLDASREKEQSLLQRLEPPRSAANPLVINEIYTMGRWKDKPLEWLVLDVEPDRALLITKDCLLQAPYNEIKAAMTWAECSLRNNLLPQLLKQIFDDKERERVLLWKNRNPNSARGIPGGTDTDDKLFLLSIDEAKKYFLYNKARAAHLNGNAEFWWLRSPGVSSYDVVYINLDGGILDTGTRVRRSNVSVRPAFWLNLQS